MEKYIFEYYYSHNKLMIIMALNAKNALTNVFKNKKN